MATLRIALPSLKEPSFDSGWLLGWLAARLLAELASWLAVGLGWLGLPWVAELVGLAGWSGWLG